LYGEFRGVKTILAAIDIGTNTVLYSLFAVGRMGRLNEIHFERQTPRIGARLAGGKRPRISQESYEIVRRILKRQTAHALAHGAAQVLIAATNPLRLATNGRMVAKRLQADLGYPVEIVSPVREGYLSFLGATGGFTSDRTTLVIDLGGGSTEFIACRGGERRLFYSLPDGAVSLTERFGSEGTVDPADFPSYETYLKRYDRRLAAIRPHAAEGTILVGGTSSTLGLLKNDRFLNRANGTLLTRDDVDRFVRLWSVTSLSGRRRLLGPERKRAEVIFAGTFWLRSVYKALSLDTARATPRGLRHGLALDFLAGGGFRA
jgi:exopolyphosphatase/guanosine-5'-triphosphate,3'-diphosphate pyrophosphatase